MERRRKGGLKGKSQNCNRDWGKRFATVGRTKECKIVSNHHFGPILGVEVGESWLLRLQVSEAGVHRRELETSDVSHLFSPEVTR